MSRPNKILIVDDNQSNVEILKDLLEDEYVLEIAFSGEECLEKVPVFKPDIILLDIMMPGIDGYTTCERLRSQKLAPYCKIIMVSAKAMIEERLAGYGSGADDYMPRPFNKDELRAKIRIYLKLITVEEADNIKSDVLSLLSHETNSPLNAVLGFADVLLKDSSLSEKHKELVGYIKKGGVNLHEFFSKVLLMSDFRAGKVVISKSSQSIKQMIDTILTRLEKKIAEKSIAVLFDSKDIESVDVDETYMFRALTFIIDNAIKFSPTNGQVNIEMRKDAENCLINISDQGVGIEEEHLSKVFDLFAVKDIMKHHEGLGLSLAIARQVVEAHDGSITVANQEKGGALVTIKLPF
ncbi:MAG: response regulator [Candidatus Omnitrophica bacterium]|nr:response regulator [Candidatus Omnitrophota bacterium]